MIFRRVRFLLLLLSLLAAGCAVGGQPEAVPTNEQPASVEPVVQETSILPNNDRTRKESTATAVPTPQPIEQAPLRYSTPVAIDIVADWDPPPYPAPLALRPEDHFYLQRPLESSADTWVHPTYRYGNTHFGEEPAHTGIDFVTDMWNPVLAAGDGVVVWAGYGIYRGTEDETDPYGLAVAVEHSFGFEGRKLYSLYGHLDSIAVIRGQPVEAGQEIGKVGNTGHASGPHLHFEVRLDENRYFHTYNPELWMVPVEGSGVLAGRIFDSWGRKLIEYPVRIRNLDTEIEKEVWTYAKEAVHSDPFYNENFVVGDLPAGPYEVYINYVGRKFTVQFYLRPGQTTLIAFDGRDGFTLEE